MYMYLIRKMDAVKGEVIHRRRVVRGEKEMRQKGEGEGERGRSMRRDESELEIMPLNVARAMTPEPARLPPV